MSRFVLGVDGGGSSTVAWVADAEGRILGRAEAGPSNMKAVGETAGLAALDAAIRGAMTDANVDEIEVACLGLAGVDRPEDRALLERWNSERRHARRLIVSNDAELVLAAGTPEGWGVAVIAGTGSICVGRAPDGRMARAGGWGHIFGDEGSGYGTAIGALRHVAWRFDGRSEGGWESDALSLSVCEAMGVENPSGLVSAVYAPGVDRARIATLAAVVLRVASADLQAIQKLGPDAAEAARSPALDLLFQAGLQLGKTALVVARRLELTTARLPLAMAGGFLLSSPHVADELRSYLELEGLELRPSRVEDPVQGAIVLALRAS